MNGLEQPYVSKSSNYDSNSIWTSFNKSITKSFTVSKSKIRYCLASSTGVQGKTLVCSSTSLVCSSTSDITSKRVLSTVPLTSTSCNINYNKKSYSSLSYSDTRSKSFLSKVSQTNTSCI